MFFFFFFLLPYLGFAGFFSSSEDDDEELLERLPLLADATIGAALLMAGGRIFREGLPLVPVWACSSAQPSFA